MRSSPGENKRADSKCERFEAVALAMPAAPGRSDVRKLRGDGSAQQSPRPAGQRSARIAAAHRLLAPIRVEKQRKQRSARTQQLEQAIGSRRLDENCGD